MVCHGIKSSSGDIVRRDFRADFGLWYDVDDDCLIQILQDNDPDIRWDWFVYFKKLDHSAILIIHPETNKVVGQIRPRGGTRQKLSREILGANVVPISYGRECRARRAEREAKRAERRGKGRGPEGC